MKKNRQNKKLFYLSLLMIFFLAFILRYWNLTAVALWHDEAFSVLMVKYSISEMLYRLGLDVHPPLYYLIFFGWAKLFSNSLFSLRFFSLLFGLLSLLGIWLFVRQTFVNRKFAFWATLIAAVNPFMILYSQEGRMYSLGLFFIVFACFFLIRAIRNREITDWFFFIVLASAASYCHYYLLFSVFALLLFLSWKIFQERDQKRTYLVRSSVISVCFLIALYLPWLGNFFNQLSQVQENYWIPKMTLWSVPNTLINLLSGGVFSVGESNWWLGVIIISTIIFLLVRGISWLWQKSQEGAVLIVISFISPFLLAILLSLKQSLYLDRYFIFVVPFYLIILTAGLFSLGGKILKQSLLLFFALMMMLSYIAFWQKSEIDNRPGMAAAEDYLTINYKSGDKILVTSSFVYFTFDYYNQTSAQPKLYAPGELSHFSGTALLDQQDIVRSFEEFGQGGDRIWLISTSGFGGFRPTPPNDWQKIGEREFLDSNSVKGSIFIEKYRVFQKKEPDVVE